MTKPQEVQYGKVPPTPAPVAFGKVPATGDVVASVPGDGAPDHAETPEPTPEPETVSGAAGDAETN